MRLTRFFAAVMIGVLSCSISFGYSGGSGTVGDPFQIANQTDLMALAATTSDYKKCFILTADIDLQSKYFTKSVLTDNPLFSGTFDGNGHKIINFNINGNNYDNYGLFGNIGSGGQIINLGVENCTINAYSGSYVGILVGEISPGGSINNCYSTGTIYISGDSSYTGGLVGFNWGNISNCCSMAFVTGDSDVGGLVGYNTQYSIINDCYSTGSVIGSIYSGGLVGTNSGGIVNCYSTGKVSGSSYVGGLIGVGSGAVNSFWDIETSGITTSPAGKPRTTGQMKQAVNYIGWNTPNEVIWTIDEPNDYPRLVWQNITGIPLSSQMLKDFVPGEGTLNNPYQISTSVQFNMIGLFANDWNKIFRLENGIDLSSIAVADFNKIGINSVLSFSGIFNGNRFVIRNYYYENNVSEECVGLFGYISTSGQIQQLGLDDYKINLPQGSSGVGGLAGSNGGIISNCYSNGIINGFLKAVFVGGLVGSNHGDICNSYSTGLIGGNEGIGGLTGFNDGIIQNCYSMSNVNGISAVGGLAGSNYSGGIINCYSTGTVSGSSYVGGLIGIGKSAVNSFWDIQTSGLTISAGGKGRTTVHMKQSGNYIGWNTPSETNWTLSEGVSYPRLVWENQPGGPLSADSFSSFISGAGTENDPYLINTAQQLNIIGLFPDEWGKIFQLKNDIDLSSITGTEFNKIGVTEELSFFGIFNGNQFVIHNFNYDTIGDEYYIGLFGFVGSAGQIKSLGLANCIINCSHSNYYIGGLAGYNKGKVYSCSILCTINCASHSQYVGGVIGYNDKGSVDYCSSANTVTGNYDTGGLIGYNYYGSVNHCNSSGIVNGFSGSLHVGGLIGYNYYSSIFDCDSIGTVDGLSNSRYIGGLVGYNIASNISQCSSSGDVKGFRDMGGLLGQDDGFYGGIISTCHSTCNVTGYSASWNIGGLIGTASYSDINSCYSTGNISGYLSIGGLVGWNARNGNINKCFSTGSINGTSNIGGLVGSNESIINQCYSIGVVTGYSYAGGLIGNGSSSDVSNSFWDTQTSGKMTSSGGTGKTTAQMKTLSTFTAAGWDFSPSRIDGDWQDWIISGEGVGYPIFPWECPPVYHGGSGANSDPFQIADANDILSLSNAWWDWDKQFILTCDIDMTGILFPVAIIAPDTSIDSYSIFSGVAFTGTFNGNGHVISHFSIAGGDKDYLGLFGYINLGGHVKHLGLENYTISSSSGSCYLGSLAGYNNNGTISNCYSAGDFSGDSCVGGLVGYNNYGNMIHCYFAGNVNGSKVGGLIGCNDQGNVSDSYATGTVSGGVSGGLVGLNDLGCINNCYSTCNISSSSSNNGGLVGYNDTGIINNCYSTGSVQGSYYTGGLIGINYMGDISYCYSISDVTGYKYTGGLGGGNLGGTISFCYSTGIVNGISGSLETGGLVGYNIDDGNLNNCYAAGAVSGTSRVGGLAGHNFSNISNCFSAGLVSGTSSIGGLIGYGSSTYVTNSFWNTQTSGRSTSNGGTGKTTAQMKTLSTFLSAGWDFSEDDGDPVKWYMPLDYYPQLIGLPSIPVPNVVEMTQAQAQTVIIDASLAVGKVAHAFSDSIPAGNIVGQSPAAGTIIGIGSSIDLMISRGRAIIVPNLVNMTQADAQSAITISELTVGTITTAYCNSIPAGNVISQSPVTGTLVEVGSAVNLVVSLGKPIVPNVVGNPQADAAIAITIVSLFVGTITTGYDDFIAVGSVISQSPAAGTAVNVGSAVNLVISLGPGVAVPDVSGMSQTEAQSAIVSAGFKVGTITTAYHSSVPSGNIISQSPLGGALAKAGSAINLVVSLGYFYIGGSGTISDPYQIGDAAGLMQLSNISADWNKYFVLSNDIDLSGRTFTTSIIAPVSRYQTTPFFTGVFDGNGHVISNLVINAPNMARIGLFGCVYPGGQIKNLGLENINIKGSGYVGGLVGYMYSGTITHCYSTGQVTGSSYVGGLVGYIYSQNISYCYSTCNVSGTSWIGGLAGYTDNNTRISNCYSTGSVNGSNIIGGLIGCNNAVISFCYSAGRVKGSSNVGGLIGLAYNINITNSLWDTETSGLTDGVGNLNPDPNGITGKPSAEMQMLSTYSVVGWDFAFETANGMNDYWRMCADGVDYPRLSWEYPAGDFVCPDGVGAEDLSVLTSCWLNTTQAKADIDNSDAVDFGDVLKLSQNWLLSGCGVCNNADVTGDSNVDNLDLTEMAGQWLMMENAGCRMGDLDDSGSVDMGDWAIFAGSWMEGM